MSRDELLTAILADPERFWSQLKTIEDDGLRDCLRHLIAEGSRAVRDASGYGALRARWSRSMLQLSAAGGEIDLWLGVLAERGHVDDLVAYLDELPWGVDRRPTETLIRVLAHLQEPRLVERLHSCQDPVLKLYLAAGVAQVDPVSAREALLAGPVPSEALPLLLELGYDPRLQDLPTGGWDPLEKAALASFVRRHGGSDRKLVSVFERMDAWLTRQFCRLRIDHMGCGGVLAISLAIGFLVPRVGMPFLLWIVLAVLPTATTHFSGLESARDVRRMAHWYWLVTLGAGYFAARAVIMP